MMNVQCAGRNLCALRFVLLTLVLGLPGCAGVSYKGIPVRAVELDAQGNDKEADKALVANRAADAAVDGIRYYDTSLYLLVNSDGKGGIQWRILELPDQTKLRAVKPYNMVAQLDSTLVFKNGMLTGTKEQADSTAVPRAII